MLVGKVAGIVGMCWLMLQLKWATFPEHCGWRHLLGAALLASVGFTMSLFITELAFKGQAEFILQAKMGVIIASILGGTAGYLLLRRLPVMEGVRFGSSAAS